MPNNFDNAITFAVSLPIIGSITLAAIKAGETAINHYNYLLAERQPLIQRLFFSPPMTTTLSEDTVYLIVLVAMGLHILGCIIPSTTTFHDRVYGSVKLFMSVFAVATATSVLAKAMSDPVALMQAGEKLVGYLTPMFDEMRAGWDRHREAAQGW